MITVCDRRYLEKPIGIVCWACMSLIQCGNVVLVVLRSPIHANEPSESNGMLYRTSNRVLNNGIKVIILICMDGSSQYHHHRQSSLLALEHDSLLDNTKVHRSNRKALFFEYIHLVRKSCV